MRFRINLTRSGKTLLTETPPGSKILNKTHLVQQKLLQAIIFSKNYFKKLEKQFDILIFDMKLYFA